MSNSPTEPAGHRSSSAITVSLLRYPLRRWPALGAVTLAMVVQAGLVLIAPWPMKLLVDNVLYGYPLPGGIEQPLRLSGVDPARETLLWLAVGATVVVFIVSWAVGLLSSMARVSFGQRMIYDLAGDLFGHLQRLSLRFHSRNSVGDTMRRITEDTGSVRTIVEDALLPAALAVLSLAGIFIVMWQLDRDVTLLALAVVPLMAVGLKRYSAPMAERSYEQQEVEGEIYTVVEEQLSAMPVVQAFGAEPAGDRRFAKATDATIDATLSATSVQFKFKLLLGLATAVGTAGILWLGATRVLAGSVTVGTLLVFLAYLATLYGYVETLMYAPATIQDATGAARRVMAILDTEPEVADAPGAVALPQVRGDLRLERVNFGYEVGQPVLHDIDLDVRAGETVALVGPTGAGKSTLVSLAPRFFDPWSGRVTIDGHDLREVTLRSVRAQVAVVLQEPFLFPLSIAENISYGRPDATADEIEAAARAANAHAFIERLSDGYQTIVGERGATLSGGERQRISIARALLKDAPILILDEPTSALDAETEHLLIEALERLMEGRTTLIIAHRLSTIRRADRIVVLREGRIVEQGSHADLLAADAFYAQLHRLQTESAAPVARGGRKVRAPAAASRSSSSTRRAGSPARSRMAPG